MPITDHSDLEESLILNGEFRTDLGQEYIARRALTMSDNLLCSLLRSKAMLVTDFKSALTNEALARLIKKSPPECGDGG